MNLKPEQLPAALQRSVASLFVLTGDEWLLLDEARSAIGAAAQRAGATERARYDVEGRFDWRQLQLAQSNLSLFAERRLIDLRLPGGKPGKEGGEFLRALAETVQAQSTEDIWLISLPKLDHATQKSAWFTALSEAGVQITFWPVARTALPGWISDRAAALGLRLHPEAAALLADRVEGNLLAARQELDKLALLAPQGEISGETLLAQLTDQSRFNPFDLGAAIVEGDRRRALHLLRRLRQEGVEPILLLWVLSREFRLLSRWSAGSAGSSGVPKSRAPHYDRAARRSPAGFWQQLLGRTADIDRAVKGVLAADPWQLLDRITLAACVGRLPQAIE
ncbi:DNA polymerase III subunit delta [Halothiobacillus sp. DCM-1]|uniref:DNA polymerase III subunit delta n=1 Tax=Halothiobacillus sp. DCM-1 TaxID=3112558 RepID=UPI0032459A46